MRIDHLPVPDRIERLDEARLRIGVLQALHQGAGKRGEVRQHPMDRRPAADRIAGIDHGLAPQRLGADERQRLERHLARDREHDDLAESRGFRESLHLGAGMLRRPFLKLRRLARADLDLVAVFEKSRGKCLPYDPRTDDANFHDILLRPRPRSRARPQEAHVGRGSGLYKGGRQRSQSGFGLRGPTRSTSRQARIDARYRGRIDRRRIGVQIL
jgi:hypothetical protein